MQHGLANLRLTDVVAAQDRDGADHPGRLHEELDHVGGDGQRCGRQSPTPVTNPPAEPKITEFRVTWSTASLRLPRGPVRPVGRGCQRPVAVDADREQQLHGAREGQVLGLIGANAFHGAQASPIAALVGRSQAQAGSRSS